jgi:integrase
MPREQFSDLKLRALKPPIKGQTDIWDTAMPSFGLRVSQGGSKTFVLKHRNRRITIGRFPLLSLSQARTEAKRLLAEFTLGRDRPRALPYPAAVELFLGEKAKNRRRSTIGDYRRLLGRLSFGQIADIDHDAVVRQLKAISAPYEYNHALIALRIFMNWCLKRRMISHNPTIAISRHATAARSRTLTDDELRAIYKVVSAKQTAFNNIVAVLLLTGMRRGEAAAMHASWIDRQARTITIPSSVAKNGRECVLPYRPPLQVCVPSDQ